MADQSVADRIEPATAVLLGQAAAEQAQRGDLGNQFVREAPLVEGVTNDRQHALVGEACHRGLHGALLVAEQGADIKQVIRIQ
ncbi:hypothetical protein D3C72_1767890 [compost metagenome]